ncbi:MAG: ergothioneine biosynthesis protein EgtB [Ignavibacteria bacterium]
MAAPDADALDARYAAIRSRTLALTEPLSAEDCCVQSMPDASPAKWHLAHTTWFFETFVLEAAERPFRPFEAAFRVLFNSYYNAVGARHPRPRRGMLTRPGLARVLDYRRDVDARMARLFARGDLPAALRELVVLGLHHEQQHQELILTDIKHLMSENPLLPACFAAPTAARRSAPILEWHDIEGGIVVIGHAGEGFHYDNEAPRHRVLLAPYRLASRLVTNAEFGEFITDRGYEDPRHWLAEGWDWCLAQGRSRPLYWLDDEAEFTLGGAVPRDPAAPVVHVSYYEAEAFARWAGARLPTEAEWENAAAAFPPTGHFADANRFHPRPAGHAGLAQLFGDTWEWTGSSYAPYPGYRPAEGAVGEYNGKFMVNQYVLRGGSCATPAGHIRASYRNFFAASASWQFAGIRLARDAA